jgi:hypothetical protein
VFLLDGLEFRKLRLIFCLLLFHAFVVLRSCIPVLDDRRESRRSIWRRLLKNTHRAALVETIGARLTIIDEHIRHSHIGIEVLGIMCIVHELLDI